MMYGGTERSRFQQSINIYQIVSLRIGESAEIPEKSKNRTPQGENYLGIPRQFSENRKYY